MLARSRVTIQRKIVPILAIFVAAFGAPVRADQESPAAQIKRWYELIKGTGSQQNARCDHSASRERCTEDYARLYDVAFKVIGLEMLHEEARRRSDTHAVSFYRPRYDAAFTEMKRLDKEIKDRYPLPKAQTGVLPDADLCIRSTTASPDEKVRACSAIIKSKKYTQNDRQSARFERGLAYIRLKQNDLAVSDYTILIARKPSAGAYINRGIAYFHRVPEHTAKADEAIRDFTKAIELKPDSVLALKERGKAYSWKGRSQEAIADFTKALDLQKGDVDILFERGMEYSRLGDHPFAAADLEDVLKKDSKHTLARLYIAQAFMGGKFFDRAIVLYDKILKEYPDDGNALADRARFYLAAGRIDESIRDYRALREKYPSLSARVAKRAAKAFMAKGQALVREGLQRDALSYFNEAISSDPENPVAYSLRAGVHQNLNGWMRAQADYSQAIRIDPKNPDYWNGRCWVKAVEAHGFRRGLEDALADCNEALKLNSKFPLALDSRGFVYFKMNRFKEALADYDAALEIDPKMALSIYARSWVRRQLGDAEGADRDLNAALAIDVTIGGKWDAINK